ncbi:hypothetical protein LZ31DRAFT_123278 [Colletotrichum somersetense]|nr:hypothetical protein LZ31DRAFT_123278 [Colletotrichum somersetense]
MNSNLSKTAPSFNSVLVDCTTPAALPLHSTYKEREFLAEAGERCRRQRREVPAQPKPSQPEPEPEPEPDCQTRCHRPPTPGPLLSISVRSNPPCSRDQLLTPVVCVPCVYVCVCVWVCACAREHEDGGRRTKNDDPGVTDVIIPLWPDDWRARARAPKPLCGACLLACLPGRSIASFSGEAIMDAFAELN